MKLAHFSDLHYAPSTLEEVDRCFAHAIKKAIKLGCNVAVITGDLFDHRVELHTEAVDTLLSRASMLANAMPSIALQGTFSHDVPGSLDVFKHLNEDNGIFVADRICRVQLGENHQWIHMKPGRTTLIGPLFSCLPTLNKADLAASMGIENIGAEMGEQVFNLLKGWAPANRDARKHGIPTIGLAHGTVNGCMTEHGVPMAGLDHEFTTGALFAAECDVFCLGHIHQHQMWQGFEERLAGYAGSIGRLHYGEVKPKGWVMYEIEVGKPTTITHSFIETPAKRLMDITFDGTANLQEIAAKAEEAQDAFVRVRYQINEEDRMSVDNKDIEALLKQGGARQVKIERVIIPVQRQRAAGISHLHNLNGQFRMWGKTTGNDVEPLMKHLEALQTRTVEEIVEEAIK